MHNVNVTPDAVGVRLTRLNFVGLLLASLAFVAAAVSPWAVRAISPPSEPLAHSVVTAAREIVDAARDRPRGEPADNATRVAWHAGDAYVVAVLVAGALAVVLGAGAYAFRHDGRAALATVLLGSGALVIQYGILLVSALLFCLLVAAVVHYLKGD